MADKPNISFHLDDPGMGEVGCHGSGTLRGEVERGANRLAVENLTLTHPVPGRDGPSFMYDGSESERTRSKRA